VKKSVAAKSSINTSEAFFFWLFARDDHSLVAPLSFCGHGFADAVRIEHQANRRLEREDSARYMEHGAAGLRPDHLLPERMISLPRKEQWGICGRH